MTGLVRRWNKREDMSFGREIHRWWLLTKTGTVELTTVNIQLVGAIDHWASGFRAQGSRLNQKIRVTSEACPFT